MRPVPSRPVEARTPDVAALPCARCIGRRLNVCAALDGRQLPRLFSLGAVRRWKKREILFRAGDAMGSFFKIRAGLVAVSRIVDDGRRQILALRAPGDCIGYLEEDGRYTFEGQALTDVEACSFDRREFDRFAAQNPALAAATAEALAATLRQAGEALLVVGQLSSTERVAHFLVEVDALYREREIAGRPLSLFMSRSEIADYLGLTLETVSRSFGRLRQRGLVRLGGADKVTILDEAGLRKLGKNGPRPGGRRRAGVADD